MLTPVAIGLAVAVARTAFLIGFAVATRYRLLSWELGLRTWKGRLAYASLATLLMIAYLSIAGSILAIEIGPLYYLSYFVGTFALLLVFPHTRIGKQIHDSYRAKQGDTIFGSLRSEWHEAMRKAKESPTRPS